VARRLVALTNRFAQTSGVAVLPFTEDDLASITGASLPTVNRVLTRAQEIGAIDLSGGHIVIRDRSQLAALAG
jgi:CRP-like cAMP-binding protein